MTDAKYTTIKNGALAVSGDKIAWIGRTDELNKEISDLADQVIDCRGKWILPGFVDCHTHLIWAGSRSTEFEMRLAGKTYEQIASQGGGIFSTVNAVRKASQTQLFDTAAKRVQYFLTQGITCVEIKSGYGLDLKNELKMLAVARRLGRELPVHVEPTFLGAHALPPEFSGRSDDYVDLVTETMLPCVKDQNIATAVDVFCETIAFSKDQTRTLFSKARDLGFRVKLHAEQLSDNKGAQLASEFEALSCDHLEYLSLDGVRAMARKNVVAVLLPGAFYMLKETQTPPIDLLRQYGVPMALATDLNPGTSPVFSMAPVINMGCLLFGMTCEEAVARATINGAKALGLDSKKGSLEIGKDADLVVWDIDSPADLAYLIGRAPVNMVAVSGKIEYKAKSC
ncbi:MAG: imidazolonepropionase [Desulfobacter sp.]|nr:imidazolonepropionase [Desulfobacter sp.]